MRKSKKRKTFKKRFRIKKKKPFFKKKGFWTLLLFSLALGVLFYFFIFSQTFQIQEIKISGNKKVSSEALQEIVETGIQRKIVFSTKTIFLANLNNIRKKILNDFPRVAEVKLRRDFPDALILEIQERVPMAVFCRDPEDCFKVDNKGIVFEQGREEGELIIYFQREDFSLGESLISEEHFNSILEIQSSFKQDLNIGAEKLFFSDNDLSVATVYGFEVYFDLQGDVSDQILNLELILKEKVLPEDWENLDYIDLRFGNRVFYK